jgi:PleD family two-component response regulator
MLSLHPPSHTDSSSPCLSALQLSARSDRIGPFKAVAATNRILIVDDEASIRRGLRTTLAGLGFHTVGAARGEEALSLVWTSSFDGVLLDLNMPGRRHWMPEPTITLPNPSV